VRWGGLLKPKVIPGRPPATALLPDINVGNCWPFAGPSGQIGILLARRILVSAITIEHAAREVSFDMAAAPREVEGAMILLPLTFPSRILLHMLIVALLLPVRPVWGLVEGQANLDKVAAYQEGHAASGTPSSSSLPPSPGYILLGQLEYDINAPRHVQTFAVPKDVQDLAVDIGIVVVRVASNYGADYTCLYRVRPSLRLPSRARCTSSLTAPSLFNSPFSPRSASMAMQPPTSSWRNVN
jgi:SUN domain-containing protein 1/2